MLSAVGSLRLNINGSTILLLNWTAPFTLDISTTAVDITYCVDVVNSSAILLHSECGITETEYTFPRSWCEEYTFVVTPVNVVGNGTVKNAHYSIDFPCM